MTAEPETRPLRRLRLAGRLLLLALVAAGAGLAWRERGALDAAAIARVLAHYPAAPLVFLALHTAASLIFFPRTVLAVAAGALFGAWWGTLWAALGSVLGAVAGFLLARAVNGGLIEPESLRRLGPMLLRAERGGWRAVAVLRLVPVIPHSLSNYALGLTRLDLGSYALGSLLGQLPMTFACADLGAAGETLAAGRAGWVAPTAVGLAALALSAALPRLLARKTAPPP
ncbi:MAG TPA: VTT domain-containing protein [Stellaceae bacterium]|nr:VTT domain-containing protein [Stellaceae bacterium]